MAAGINTGSSSKLSIFPGSRVSCSTCTGDKLEGEVLAFDYNHKIVVLKLPSSSGTKGTCNITFLNADLLREFAILEEPKKPVTSLPAIDMNKICQRTETNLLNRQKAVERIGVGVSPLGQMLFDTISKQYSCYWECTNICVKDLNVSVVSPYKSENCKGNSKATEHIKKLIEKFHEEQAAPP